MAGHDDRQRVAAKGLPDVAGKPLVAELRCDSAIGRCLAGQDRARCGIDLSRKGIDPAKVAGDEGEIRSLPFEQSGHRRDGATNGGRRFAPGPTCPRGQTAAGVSRALFRQLGCDDHVIAPGNAAVTEGSREEREVHHGSLYGKDAVDRAAIARSGLGHSDEVVKPCIAGIAGLELRRRTKVVAPGACWIVWLFKIGRIVGIFRCRPEPPLPLDVEQRVIVRFQAEADIEDARPVRSDADPVSARVWHHTPAQVGTFERAAFDEEDHASTFGRRPHVHWRKVQPDPRFEQELKLGRTVRVPAVGAECQAAGAWFQSMSLAAPDNRGCNVKPRTDKHTSTYRIWHLLPSTRLALNSRRCPPTRGSAIGPPPRFGANHVRYAHTVKLKFVRSAHNLLRMIDRTANLLGVVGRAVADRIEETARTILNHAGETPAALVVIGYGGGPSNDQLRRILGLSHPGTVRLVDRLVADGLVERREGRDRRAIALYLSERGLALREDLLKGRLATIRPLLTPLTDAEQETLAALLHKMLSSMETTATERRMLCRLCDSRICTDCPIPADARAET